MFQDFAHVLCQRFIEVPSNRDLVNLTVLGDGVLQLAIADGKATHNGHAVAPFAYSTESLTWLHSRLDALKISRDELRSAVLTVEYKVALRRKPGLGWLCIDLHLICQASIRAADREYVSSVTADTAWGLMTV